MKVQVLGVGCPKCIKTFQNVERALAELGGEVEIEKVEKIDEIMKFGIMMTPALVVDGEIKAVGKVPSVAEVKEYLLSTK